ncbi:MAG: alanine--tRNA ligase [Patescibacteria group bacterium]
MTTPEIRQRFLDFFAKRGHAAVPSASLVPKNDPSVLFNTAGMQPLVPYLMGRPHPLGNRLASSQKCVRTGDIEEVGNHKNLTFFEMLGNWSLGDYFKEEAIKWSFEFLTSKEEGLGLDPARLYVTVFEGDENAPRDMEAVEIWKNYIPEHRIYFLPAKNNWWSPGDNGPCGPDSEMFYDVTPEGLGDMTHDEYVAADDVGTVVEIWNDVFMQYEKQDGVVVGKLAQKNVDTGSGLERVAMLSQGKTNVYEADMFAPVMAMIKDHSENYTERNARIIADHLRCALFLIADGVTPSNKDQGYILRRIIRRAALKMKLMSTDPDIAYAILTHYTDFYAEAYPELLKGDLQAVFKTEEEKFTKTLQSGLREFEKGVDPFMLATTYGFPIEITEELALEKCVSIDRDAFNAQMKAHQDASRAGAAAKFKGGLADTGEKTTQLHTAHHLLLAALQKVLGKEVHQRGSNITEERLRIDFSFDRKMTDEEKAAVELQVNEWINTNHKVCRREMPRAEAEQIGAEMEFGTKYPDVVSVYMIEDAAGNAISKEFCGGPHVEETKGLGVFKIQKEEAVAAGIRRIKATLS